MRLGQLDHHVIHLIWMHEYIRILQLISVARRTTHEATLHQGFDPATWRSLGWTAPLLCGSPCIIGDFNPKNSPGKGLTPHSNPSKPNKKPSIHPTSVLGLNGRITLKRTPVAHRASRGPDRHATQGQHAAWNLERCKAHSYSLPSAHAPLSKSAAGTAREGLSQTGFDSLTLQRYVPPVISCFIYDILLTPTNCRLAAINKS